MFKAYQLRKKHKWLALLVGWQLFLWSISGLYMTFVDLDIIHGDHLVDMPAPAKISSATIQPIDAELLQQLAPIRQIRLKSYFDLWVYEVIGDKTTTLVSASSGKRQQPLTKQQIIQRAKQIYTGEGDIQSINRLQSYPKELGSRQKPVWQVNFDDPFNPSLYFDPLSGRLISKRSDLWRVFDALWVLHIMDYWGSNQFEGYLFRIVAILSLFLTLFGAGLLYFRLKKGQQ
ncbi:MAG: PepSY domain-containing protein [Enterobacterales bacterium]|nr:PepSY domain-containing protein [Enterobacterales bacterium]